MSEIKNYQSVTDITLIGSGEPFIHAAKILLSSGYNLKAILAPRHATNILPLSNKSVEEALSQLNIKYYILEDINEFNSIADSIPSNNTSLALCFGPAWVFPRSVTEHFGAGMINFNGIPIPRYLGGAHYTWQILNGDRTVGMAMQEITMNIDRGDILRFEEFLLGAEARVPQDYYEGTYKIACSFIEKFIDDIKNGESFKPVPYDIFEGRRFYFPRLLTLHQGYIDWSWTAEEIVRFCCAFDKPYPGASTYINNNRVHIKNVSVEKGDGYTHPFCTGLIVRQSHGVAWVASKCGILVIREAVDENGKDILQSLKEGRRLYTPSNILDGARKYQPVIAGKL
ncbi:MAG TPA: hypothetical protein ENH23_05230 [candidate division Zixibacteria bacterium]|nr:hypothetical protein [candidate division Zixibacteria bacterium]